MEHLLAEPGADLTVGLLRDILHTAPEVRLPVTSREVLNQQEEWVFPMHGLPFPQSQQGDTLLCTEIEPACANAWPLQVEIVLAGDRAGETEISLNGFYCGWGPIETGYVQEQVRTLRAGIEKVMVRRSHLL